MSLLSKLGGGGGQSAKIVSVEVSTRATTADDNGKLLINSGASNRIVTIAPGMPTDFVSIVQQEGVGTITLVAGAGVTFKGTTTATILAGNRLMIVWVATNTYRIYASAG